MTDKSNLLDWFSTENLTSHLLNIFVRQWPLWSNIGQISLSRLPIREDLQAPSLMMLMWALPLHFFFILVSTARKFGIFGFISFPSKFYICQKMHVHSIVDLMPCMWNMGIADVMCSLLYFSPERSIFPLAKTFQWDIRVGVISWFGSK